MTDSELILRAGLAPFSDADRVVAVNLNHFDPLNSRDDLVRLLLATGISFSRPSNIHIAAAAGGDTVKVTIENGDELAAAARAACEVAASWIHDDDVQAWAIATLQAVLAVKLYPESRESAVVHATNRRLDALTSGGGA